MILRKVLITDVKETNYSKMSEASILVNTKRQIEDIVVRCGLNSVPDAAPPSLHMRLGHGLANADCAPKNISCFGSTEGNLTTGNSKGKKLLSESDLFTILDCPVEDSCQNEKSQI